MMRGPHGTSRHVRPWSSHRHSVRPHTWWVGAGGDAHGRVREVGAIGGIAAITRHLGAHTVVGHRHHTGLWLLHWGPSMVEVHHVVDWHGAHHRMAGKAGGPGHGGLTKARGLRRWRRAMRVVQDLLIWKSRAVGMEVVRGSHGPLHRLARGQQGVDLVHAWRGVDRSRCRFLMLICYLAVPLAIDCPALLCVHHRLNNR